MTAAYAVDGEVPRVLEAIYHRLGHDFRHYAAGSLERRLRRGAERLGCRDFGELRALLLADRAAAERLLCELTVGVSEMFRDPGYYRAIRERVVPFLRTYPSPRLWVAGCASGEEAYSLCIVLAEERLLERSRIYATDINPAALETARRGVFPEAVVRRFTHNYQRAGGRRAFSRYYTAAYGSVRFDAALVANVVFADHSLATDAVFAEVQLVSCRNVLIYFDHALQERAIGLFRGALSPAGFLGLGPRETIRFSRHRAAFKPFADEERIYQKH